MASQYPNLRTMITLENVTYKSGTDEKKDDDMSPLIGSDEEVKEEQPSIDCIVTC